MVSCSELIQRNQKFILGISANFDFVEQRYLTSDNQSPHTIVITSSDSRVTQEHIFQCGIGELFVAPSAGNILDSIGIENVEFAIEKFDIQQIILIGHTNSGALSVTFAKVNTADNYSKISQQILPLIHNVLKRGITHRDDVIEATIRLNLSKQLNKLVKRKSLISKLQNNCLWIYLIIYYVSTGKLEVIETLPK